MAEQLIKENKPLPDWMMKEVGDEHIKFYCKTCRILFLDIPLTEYNRMHDYQRGDKWFVETGIHWFEHQDHEIVQETAFMKLSISDIWRQKYKLELSRGRLQLGEKSEEETVKRCLEHFYKYREEWKNKPI